MNRVLTVGCKIPGSFGEYVDLRSQVSLFDADFVLFCPSIELWAYGYTRKYQGKETLSEEGSFELKETMNHWQKELALFLDTGRTVFMLMADLDEFFVDTGERTYSGTGKNRVPTRHVTPMSNYELLPFTVSVTASNGNSMKCHQDTPFFRGYWQEFSKESQYFVYFENATEIDPLVVTRDGSRVVGGAFRSKGGGTLIALPWLNLLREEFFEDFGDFRKSEPKWTSAAKGWGQRFLETLISIDAAITSRSTATPTPQWARNEEYSTNREAELSRKLLEIQTQFAELEKTQEEIETEIASAGSLRALLFEQSRWKMPCSKP